MSFKANVLILVTCALTDTASGQNAIDAPVLRDTVRWLGSMYMDIGIPVGEFAMNMDRYNGLGIGGEVLYRLQPGGLIWGGIGVHSFALDRFGLNYSQQIDDIIYNYREQTTSRIFMAHAVLRFQPGIRFLVRPYIQGAFGSHWFFTNTKIRDTDLEEIVERINEHTDVVLGFALHGGVHIVPHRLPDLRGDLRVGYFRNASVEYLRYREDLLGNFPVAAFERKVSAVDMVGIHIGLTIFIRGEK